jgi:hypothetical protein
VAVDADPAGAGIDVAAGLDDEPGVRWSDMVGVRGALPAAALRGRMPRAHDVDWLATPAGTANAASWSAVLSSVRSIYDSVVVDLPRYRLTATPPPPGAWGVLVTALDLAALANARTILDSGRLGPDPVVAVRSTGGPLRMSAAAESLAGYRLVELPSARGLRGAADFGDLPSAVGRGAFGRACAGLEADLAA